MEDWGSDWRMLEETKAVFGGVMRRIGVVAVGMLGGLDVHLGRKS